MPIRCVAACAGGCSNTYKDGVSFFKFPIDQPRRRIWINKVLTTRASRAFVFALSAKTK